MAADICVIVPAGLAELATDDAPTTPAGGVALVLVNGTVAWRDGALVSGARSGQVVS